MTRRWIAVIVPVSAALVLLAAAPRQDTVTSDQVASAIDKLGSFDFPVRTEASRVVRRAPAPVAVPALDRAARSHHDEYVRFRALVILAGFGDAAAGQTMRDLMGDRNDRLRTVAYQWFEHHPDPVVLPALINAMRTEKSEFVRPAVTRAVAAFSDDPRARDVLAPLVMRGEDLFRGALIEALGDYGGRFALPDLIEVAKLEGPLQDDAITSIGKLGDASARATLSGLQKSGPREVQPTISAAFCLLKIDCPAQQAYLEKTLAYAAGEAGDQPLLRGVVHALAVLATRGQPSALSSLIDVGTQASDPARAPVALGVGLVALRDPLLLVRTLETRKDVDSAVELVRDAFDMLSEDLEEERFSVEVRRAYWEAPADSARRRTAQLLIDKLEF